MSRPNKMTGKAPRQRINLRGRRRRVELQLRQQVYEQAMKLADEGEPLVAVVERLILDARPVPQLCR